MFMRNFVKINFRSTQNDPARFVTVFLMQAINWLAKYTGVAKLRDVRSFANYSPLEGGQGGVRDFVAFSRSNALRWNASSGALRHAPASRAQNLCVFTDCLKHQMPAVDAERPKRVPTQSIGTRSLKKPTPKRGQGRVKGFTGKHRTPQFIGEYCHRLAPKKFGHPFSAMFLIVLFIFAITPLLAQQPDLGTEAQRAAGKVLYNQKCAQCHGENGDGQDIATPYFKPAPRDFTRGQYKIRTTGTGELPTDEDLKNIIKKGMPYTGMPAWPDLSDEQIMNLVYYIKTFTEDFADPDYFPTALEMPKAPPYSEESAQKGRAIFEANECIACHGNSGRGDGPSAPDIVDDWGNHIRAADMTKLWTYRGGATREDIYRTFTTGVNGTPMPSYSGLISPEDQWHLVDYVYSLSREKPGYGTVVISKPHQGELDISQGKTLFKAADSTYFPIVGQVIEPGREYYPGVNGIYVKAVHNVDEIAIMLNWNDMRAERSGNNSPNIEVSEESTEAEEDDDPFGDFEEDISDDPFADVEAEESYSDAVAIQFPSKMPEGQVKPYMIFGDRRNAVDLWFVDLAKDAAEVFIGKGSDNVTLDSTYTLEMASKFEDGEWTVIFKRKRQMQDRLPFDEGAFIPIAFSVWDGFNKERGNKRGLSSWYNLYLEPMEQTSAVLPMLKWGFLTILFELVIIGWVRIRNKSSQGS